MKLTLIKPNIGRREHSLYVDEARMEPLMLAVLAGLTPQDVEVVLFDDRMEPVRYDDPTDLAAITVDTFTARRAYEIAAEFRSVGTPVILGGMHVALMPEEAGQNADSIFIGDAETVWGEVIADARRGKLKPRYYGPPGIAQINGTMPRRYIFKGKGYLPISLMQFSRGCRYECDFCAVSHYFGKKHNLRHIDEVIREIESQERKFLFFVDDNIASDRQGLKELCHALIPMKVQWVSQASLDVASDGELMGLMERSGCWGNVIGFESMNADNLMTSGKTHNFSGFPHYEQAVSILREHGMQTWAAFTLGYDGDNVQSINETVDFALESKFAFAAFNILMPYPGTMFYKKLLNGKRLLFGGKWWLHPEYRFNQAAFVPALISSDELTDACHAARKRFNSFSSLIRRFSDWDTNLQSLSRALSFWRYTLLFRKELYKKHGMRLGLK
jgi:radical SAM superfamily enzyme YgiQ (UPF0313 family)